MTVRPYIAELLGTFTLTLLVSLSLASVLPLPVATPFIAAATLGTFVYTIGWMSGAHVNPAVTIALATVKKISVQDAVYYILAQLVGALLASFVVWYATGTSEVLGVGPNTALVTIAEAIGTFLLVWGVSAVVDGRVSKDLSGIVVGASLLLGIVAALGAGSNGVINPAVALGLHTFATAYIVGPIVGGIAAAWAYRALAKSAQ